MKAYTGPPSEGGTPISIATDAGKAKWGQILQAAVAGGAQGVGMAPGYMGNETAHIGFGSPAAWGDGGHTAKAPDWVKEAWNAGMKGLPLENVPNGTAPTPMPGRPAALSGSAGRDSIGAGPNANELTRMLDGGGTPVTVNGGTQLAKLPSGQMIAPGIYPQPGAGDHSLRVSVGPDGNAIVEKILHPGEIPGVLDPVSEANAPTLAGNVIRQFMKSMPQDVNITAAVSGAGTTLGESVKANALAPLENIGSTFGAIGSQLTSGLGAIFHPPTAAAPGRLAASGAASAGTGASGSAASPLNIGEVLQRLHDLRDSGAFAPPGAGGLTASGAVGAGNPLAPKGDLILAQPAKSANSWGWPELAQQAAQAHVMLPYGNDNALAPSLRLPATPAASGSGIASAVTGLGPVQQQISPAWSAWKAEQDALHARLAASGGIGQFAGAAGGVVPMAPEPPKFVTVHGGSQPAQVAPAPPPPPPVQLASGNLAQVGTTGSAQGGAYQYVVQADGSVLNQTTGRVSAPAVAAVPQPTAQQQNAQTIEQHARSGFYW